MNGKKLARTMETLTACIRELADENAALRNHLRRISLYQSTEKMRRDSEKDWGLPFEEALEMAYENVIQEAKNGLAWKPKTLPSTSQQLAQGPGEPRFNAENES
jgi:hypothetical protein